MLFLFQGCLRLSFKKWTGLQDCKNTYLVNPVLPGATQIHIGEERRRKERRMSRCFIVYWLVLERVIVL